MLAGPHEVEDRRRDRAVAEPARDETEPRVVVVVAATGSRLRREPVAPPVPIQQLEELAERDVGIDRREVARCPEDVHEPPEGHRSVTAGAVGDPEASARPGPPERCSLERVPGPDGRVAHPASYSAATRFGTHILHASATSSCI